MAGHSHAKNVMRRKTAKNSKKSKILTKASLSITNAIKLGGSNNPETNIRLKHAIKYAQIVGASKEIIKKALEKTQKEDLEEIIYEGYAAGGIAILIEAITNNKIKTASEIRSIFAKYKGTLSEPNTVAFMFDHVGIIECDIYNHETDLLIELAANYNAIDIQDNIVLFDIEYFHQAQEAFEKDFKIVNAEMCYIPKNRVQLDSTENFYKLLETLEENESTQNCWHNLEE